ncbi:monocarboxylate transporter 9-like isoform X2 [Dermacentor albipictus]|uniref:monocarboxylate transporter 9-like isoform X2 n=1 Tax=Dermacentor albipictus TaxID=60249 RepID=UPI0031FE3993
MSDQDQLKRKTRLQRFGPDSVHSWMTAGACGLSSFFASCAVRSGGFVFVAVQEKWQTSRRDAAWPVLMMAAGIQASGVLSGPLAQRFTVRPVAIAGSIMASVGLILSFFATSTAVLTLTLGAIHGIGAGMVIMSQPMCLVQHFIIHKGLATGLNFAGSALAFFVFPMLMEVLTEVYGFGSAILLFGAISLNATAFTLFVRQPDWLGPCTLVTKGDKTSHQCGGRSSVTATPSVSKTCEINVRPGNAPKTYDTAREGQKISSTGDEPKQNSNLQRWETTQTTLIAPDEPMTIKFMSRRVSMSAVFESVANAVEIIKKFKKCPEPGSLRHGLTVVKEPIFYLILYTFLCYSLTFDCYSSLLVDFAVGKGIAVRSAVTMTSITALVDLAARLLLPSIADRGILSRVCMLVFVKLTITIVMFLLPHVSSYGVIFALASCIGLYVGCVVVMCSVLIAEFLGVDRVPLTYGLVTGVTGLTAFAKPPLIGYFRDRTGSYDAVFQLCGLLQLICFLLWLSVCVAERFSKRRKWSPKDELNRAAMHVCKFVYLPGAGFSVCSGSPCDLRDDQKVRKPSMVTTLCERSCSVAGLS